MPFPIEPDSKIQETSMHKNKRNKKIVVGVVGYFRPEKGFLKILKLLQQYQRKNQDIQILVGTPKIDELKSVLPTSCTIVNTTSYSQYVKALKMSDILLVNYDKSKYFVRHSGVILEAISHGVVPVCPNFPLMKSQLSWPTVKGVVFDDLSQIEDAVDHARNINETFKLQE